MKAKERKLTQHLSEKHLWLQTQSHCRIKHFYHDTSACVCQHFSESPLLRTVLAALWYCVPLWIHHREMRLFTHFHLFIQTDDTFPIWFDLIFLVFVPMIWYAVAIFFHIGNWGILVCWEGSNCLNIFLFSNVTLPCLWTWLVNSILL